jgi:Zn-dependent protease/CBS domain-containing protein
MTGIKIGRLFGIEVAIHPSWFLVLVFFAFALASGFFPSAYPDWSTAATWTVAVAATLLLFVSVLAHEFGHSLVARSQGIPVRNITLFFLGGVAQLTREPDSPGREAWMAFAGPLVSIGVAAGALGAAYVLPGPEQLVALLAYLGIANAVIVVFNLLPGFPLDGGRVLRALLWRITQDRVRATTWAAAVGQAFAAGFIALGAVQIVVGGSLGGLWLIFIGWMMIQAARATAQHTLTEQQLAGVSAARLMTPTATWVSPYATLDWAAHERLRDWDTRCVPVAPEDPDAEYGGLVCTHDLERAARERHDRDRVRDVMTPAPKLPTVTPETGAVDVLRVMRERETDRAVVVDEGGHMLGFVDVDAFTRFLSVGRGRRHLSPRSTAT